MMMMIPIVITLVGIVTAVSPVHRAKASVPNIRVSINIDDDSDVDDDDGTDSSDTSRNSNSR
jgi:hypothetical protein